MAKKLFFKSASGAAVFVNTGFSWEAFLFGPLWAVAKRQWLLFFLLCIAQLPFTAIFMLAEQRKDTGLFVLSLLLSLIYMILCGVFCNRWHRRLLERQGYVFEGFA